MEKQTKITPHRFYRLVDVYQNLASNEKKAKELESFMDRLNKARSEFDEQADTVKGVFTKFVEETDRGTRSRVQSSWSTSEDINNAASNFSNTLRHNLLFVVNQVTEQFRGLYQYVQNLAEGLTTQPLMLSGNRIDIKDLSSFKPERMQQMTHEINLNGDAVMRFVGASEALRRSREKVLESLETTLVILRDYRKNLAHRHSNEGIKVFIDPLITDVALCIYENIDSHGEIEDGTSPDEVSAYSIQKGVVLVEATRTGLVGLFLRDPKMFVDYIHTGYQTIWNILRALEDSFNEVTRKVVSIVNPYRMSRQLPEHYFRERMDLVKNLDPREVTFRDRGTLMSAEERHAHKFMCDTLSALAEKIKADPPHDSGDIVRYILERKAKLFQWHREENSFFVCRIGAGNQFKGIAPGALEVIPGDRPAVDLENILGSGYDDIRRHIDEVEASSEWFDLFVATSPSKTADKSNVLMIGPAGCGKSEVLRGVGSDGRSLSIYAQGSDFNTCWMGEAQKNPKRLFQAGVKLSRKADKHVHFLIDEIDAVLNNDRHNAGYINLTLEFQMLMDGVVAYPNLSVWGTTNNPERIPMPMIRRFSKVAVVGELDQEDRVNLLKHFAGYMPWDDFQDQVWEDQAKRLEGATGDVLRKVIDIVWRTLMTDFVHDHKSEARSLIKWLNLGEKFDVRRFSDRRREAFKTKLGEFVQVTPDQIVEAVDSCLSNVAILHEIENAKWTYENAKQFLTVVQKGGLNVVEGEAPEGIDLEAASSGGGVVLVGGEAGSTEGEEDVQGEEEELPPAGIISPSPSFTTTETETTP